jgi:hypothetical protein
MAFALIPEIAVMAPEAIAVGGEVAAEAGSIFGSIGESIGGLFGRSVATSTAEVGMATATDTGIVAADAGTAGSVTLAPGVQASGLTATGTPIIRGGTDVSARTIFGSLPKFSTTTKVVGGAVAVDAGYNLVQNLRDTNQTLIGGLENVPGGVISDAETLMNHGGLVTGKLLGSTVSGISKGAFGDSSAIFEIALAAGALYLFTR